MPFTCTYCGECFCAAHRLPEHHECKGDLAQKKPVIKKTPQKTTKTGAYSYNNEDDFID